ncbi:hypothetical protein SUNI508_02369 [Seiridium unicorne]|uniref:Uncharacterized protein n=1 Tax=Seiridium unicorne TaxID=138068 RepID=A0ABR2UIG4_9PEZI
MFPRRRENRMRTAHSQLMTADDGCVLNDAKADQGPAEMGGMRMRFDGSVGGDSQQHLKPYCLFLSGQPAAIARPAVGAGQAMGGS